MRTRLLALLGAAALMAPAAAQAQNPLSSIFSCNNPNNRQQTGAIAGAVIGGLLGNQIDDDNRTTGTIIGGLLGAAAGSAIGCQMSSSDASRAEEATRRALEQGRSTTWSNSANGTSGRIDIVDTYRVSDAGARQPDPNYDYRYDTQRDDYRYTDQRYDDRYDNRRPLALSDIRFAYGVQQPVNYRMIDASYATRARTNVRAGPSSRARVLTQLRSGETFDALAWVSGGWLLAGKNGQAIGYISESVVLPNTGGISEVYTYNTPSSTRYSEGQVCRVFDQTIQRRGQTPTTERFTACQTARGEWMLQG